MNSGKRMMDLVCACAGLLLSFPFWFIIAIWIKMDSTGPVFFVHKRVGRYGKEFGMFKFRTMVVSQPSAVLQVTAKNDQRITRVGTFLRHYKLDELPQFLNVLLGQMSMVGPRPEASGYMKYYTPEERALILSVKPGMTDLASLKFRHEETLLAQSNDPLEAYIKKILPKKMRYIRFYITHASLGYDISLLFETFKIVLMKG